MKYQEGDCLRNVNPYEGEPEYMVIETEVKGHEDCYLTIALYGDGRPGQYCIMPHSEVDSWSYKKQN